MTNSPPVQEYWLAGYELSRQIVLRQIQYFLGPSATVRPYSYQGREGYLIVGTPLTKQQIADLRRQSKEYERQQTIRMKTKRTGSDAEEPDLDINSIIVFGSKRNHQHGRPGHRDGRI